MGNSEAVCYLQSLLDRTLRVHTTDRRMFVGTFKCTDAVGVTASSYLVNAYNFHVFSC